MDESIELELVRRYPKILKNYGGDPMQTCMAHGFECQNGWFNLLDKCMEKLQYFCDLCSINGREVQVVAEQIKSKFATLHFYVTISGSNDIEISIISTIINEAEDKSERTCEICGEHGKIYTNGWHMCLCKNHAIENKKLVDNV
jgi:hypothetical protein